MIGYQDWPEGFTKGGYAFAGGVFDGQHIWMIPFNTDQVIKVDSVTGQMTGYNHWPSDLNLGESSANFFVGSFRGGAFDDENIWMVPYNANQVVKLNKETGQMTGYDAWPDGFTKAAHAFSGGIYDGTSLWMIPVGADRVIQLNTETGQMTGYDAWPEEFVKELISFASGVFDGRNIWLIPYNADQIVKLDTETGEMTGYDAWPEGFTKSQHAFAGGVYDGESVWMVPLNASQVVKVNTLSGEMDSYELPSDALQGSGSIFQGGVYDGQSIWLLPYSDGIGVVRIDKMTGEMTTYKNWPSGFSKGLAAFSSGVFDGESIWMIPYSADRIIKLSASPTYTIEEIDDQHMSPLIEGYVSGAQETKIITIARNGTGDLTNLAVDLSGTDAEVFEISQPRATTLNNEMGSTTFTLQAKAGLEVGTYTALVSISADQMDDVTFTITQVVVGVNDSVISPMTASFDKHTASAAYADVTTEITWNGNTLSAIENREILLLPDIDYTVIDNVVTIKKEYLAAQPVGTTYLSFSFSAGEQQTMVITVRNTTPVFEDVPNNETNNDSGWTLPNHTYLIPSSGATISFKGGQITIPKGAWRGSFYLTIHHLSGSGVQALTDTLSFAEKAEFVSTVVEIKKDKPGAFQKEITLSLELTTPVSTLKGEGQNSSLYWLNETTNTWVELDNINVDGEKNTVSGTIDHFTKFAAIATQVAVEEEEVDLQDTSFSDISGHWAEESIRRLAVMGAVGGYPDGSFQPSKFMTRSEFVKILVQAFQLKLKGEHTLQLPFEDMHSHWANEMISVAYAYDIIQGYNEIIFGPDEPITREQMAVMIGNLLKVEKVTSKQTFMDQGFISDWAQQNVMSLVENEIMNGYPDQTFKPGAFATRAEVATVILRALEKQ